MLSVRYLVAEHVHCRSSTTDTNSDASSQSTCLLFAPAEYFKDPASKLQLARTLSSSFRITTHCNATNESADEPSTHGQQQQSPTASHQTLPTTSETSPALVYVLCVPISSELESEWRGTTHKIPTNNMLTSILPLNTHWKTTTIFLFTQQVNSLNKFEESFKERLSTTNIQQNDLYDFETKSGQLLQKRSCFKKVDQAMSKLAHAMLRLSNRVANNVEQFEKMIDENHIRDYVVSCSRSTSIVV
jgi:hypothetical protein